MNLDKLKAVFLSEMAATNAKVMVLPSSLTKEAAKGIVDKIPLESVVHSLAVIMAQEVGNHLQTMALRPADYFEMREIPDELIERIIEELAKKPDVFFNSFKDQLKIQG